MDTWDPLDQPRRERQRSLIAKIAFAINLVIGLPLLAGTGLLVWLWRSPDAAPHGRGFALGALWLGMGALAFLLSAGAIRLGWRAWWIVQLLPLLWAAPFVASFL